jgi:hypothetical protein
VVAPRVPEPGLLLPWAGYLLVLELLLLSSLVVVHGSSTADSASSASAACSASSASAACSASTESSWCVTSTASAASHSYWVRGILPPLSPATSSKWARSRPDLLAPDICSICKSQ